MFVALLLGLTVLSFRPVQKCLYYCEHYKNSSCHRSRVLKMINPWPSDFAKARERNKLPGAGKRGSVTEPLLSQPAESSASSADTHFVSPASPHAVLGWLLSSTAATYKGVCQLSLHSVTALVCASDWNLSSENKKKGNTNKPLR